MPAYIGYLIKRKLAEVYASWRWLFFNAIVIIMISTVIVFDKLQHSFPYFLKHHRGNIVVHRNSMSLENLSYFG